MIGAQEWYYAVLFLTIIAAFIIYFSISKKPSHFLYTSFIGLYIITLDYDLQVLGQYFEEKNFLKFIAYLFSTILFTYLGYIISKNNKEDKKIEQKNSKNNNNKTKKIKLKK